MTESESVALPLGDAPKYSFDLDDQYIIADTFCFVKWFFEKNQKILLSSMRSAVAFLRLAPPDVKKLGNFVEICTYLSKIFRAT